MLLRMMAYAGRGLATHARGTWRGDARGRRTVSVDLRSGLDGDGGEASDATIRATETLTLAIPKRGLLAAAARPWVGRLYLADMLVPEKVYRRLGLTVGPIFAESDII